MREIRQSGSEGGVAGNGHPYPYLECSWAIFRVVRWGWDSPGGQLIHGPEMQTPQIGGGALVEDAEEATEARSAGNRLDAEGLCHSRIRGHPGHPATRDGVADDTAQKSLGDVAGAIGDGASRLVRGAFLHGP